MKIYKYELPSSGKHILPLPYNSEILGVLNQHESLVLYAHVDLEQSKMEDRTFVILMTGQSIDSGTNKFIGTVLFAERDFTVHVFEELMV